MSLTIATPKKSTGIIKAIISPVIPAIYASMVKKSTFIKEQLQVVNRTESAAAARPDGVEMHGARPYIYLPLNPIVKIGELLNVPSKLLKNLFADVFEINVFKCSFSSSSTFISSMKEHSSSFLKLERFVVFVIHTSSFIVPAFQRGDRINNIEHSLGRGTSVHPAISLAFLIRSVVGRLGYLFHSSWPFYRAFITCLCAVLPFPRVSLPAQFSGRVRSAATSLMNENHVIWQKPALLKKRGLLPTTCFRTRHDLYLQELSQGIAPYTLGVT